MQRNLGRQWMDREKYAIRDNGCHQRLNFAMTKDFPFRQRTFSESLAETTFGMPTKSLPRQICFTN